MQFAVVFLVALVVVSSSALTLRLQNRPHRIVGGTEAVPHSIPSILNLGFHSCGATLIHPKWAITAAYCIPISGVVAGDHVINIDEGNEQRRDIIRNIVHPDYQNPGQFSNDVALLELESEFDINEFVQIATTPAFDFAPTGDALVAGWGTTETGGLSNFLREVTVPLVSQADCIIAYGSDIDDSMICAGEADKDSCEGDVGGPMFCTNDDGSQVLCGTVSWGYRCGLPGFPGVYSRTSFFRNFIDQYVPAQ